MNLKTEPKKMQNGPWNEAFQPQSAVNWGVEWNEWPLRTIKALLVGRVLLFLWLQR